MPSFTPNLNLYLPGGGSESIGGSDEAADIDKLNKNFQKIDEVYGPVIEDTGWVNIASGFEPGFTTGGVPGTLQYRIKGGVVYWRGGVNGSLPSGVYTRVVAGFPTAARPSDNGGPVRFGGGSSGASPVFVEISSLGNITIAHSSGSNRVWAAFAVSYPVG